MLKILKLKVTLKICINEKENLVKKHLMTCCLNTFIETLGIGIISSLFSTFD